MLTKAFVESGIQHVFETLPGNQVSEEDALLPEAVGLTLFDSPIVGIGSATDPLFETLKQETAVGPWYMMPAEWYPEARSVVSIFFPLTETIRRSNRTCTAEPSPQWLHGRIEGQKYIMDFGRALGQWFAEQGIGFCFPGDDPRFTGITAGDKMTEYGCVTKDTFSSNWSERHIAYVCGLGTFSLSKAVITRKGIAGRFVSIIINADVPADIRPYESLYENCIMCGACMRRCPLNSISMEKGNDLSTCYRQISAMQKKHAPRYGCGLCQTSVPCEDRIPGGKG